MARQVAGGRWGFVPLLVAVFQVFGTGVGAQEEVETLRSDEEGVRVRGEVRDRSTSRPIPVVALRLEDRAGEGGVAWEGLSDSTGVFRAPRVRPGHYDLHIEALGYDALSHGLTLSGYGIVELEVELAPIAFELEPIVVVSRRRSRLEAAGFFRRRALGFGHSFIREEIDARDPALVSDLLRSLPGVSFSQGTLGRAGVMRMRGGCVPEVVVDGARAVQPVPLDEVLRVSHLEAIEVYGGATAPAQYARSSCGVVLVWTRDPGSAGGRSWSWKRAGAVGGVVLLGVMLLR